MINSRFKIAVALLSTVLGFITISIIGIASYVQAKEQLPGEVKSCLTATLGATATEEILSGSRQPSDEEKGKGKSCLGTLIKADKNAKISEDKKACIKRIAGKEITSETDVSEAVRAKIGQECFGDGEKEHAIAFPKETRRCIVSVLGTARAEQLFNGEEPTEAEKAAAGPKCFGGGAGPGGAEGMKKLSAKDQQCIANLGIATNRPPSESEKKLIGQKCFGDEAREQGRTKLQNMTEADKSCLSEVGIDPNQPGKPTADQEKALGECFGRKNTPESVTREEATRRTSDMNDTQRACVRGKLGRNIEDIGQPNPEQEAVIRECRTGNPAVIDPNNGNPTPETSPSGNGNSGQSSAPPETPSVAPDSIGRLKTETQSCIAERLGLTVGTLGSANYNDPNVEQIVMTCKTNNGEQ